MKKNTKHNRDVESLFDSKAKTWSQKYNGPLIPRLSLFTETARRHIPHESIILDFGCGTGELSKKLSEIGFKVHGIDISSEMITTAKSNIPFADRLTFQQGDISTLAGTNEKFDAIVSSSVLEYIPDTRNVLGIMRAAIRERGILIATLPNSESTVRKVERLLRSNVFWLHHLPWTRRIKMYLSYIENSRQHFSLREFQGLAEDSGFRVVEATYLTKELPDKSVRAKKNATLILYVLAKH
jgi:2-polyprenyl-3-methyl-5-hydroxy-6-metoxy-1,4-benzoquinol methylase